VNKLFDKKIHRDEFRLRVLMTNGCNKNCPFCLNDFQEKPKDKPRFVDVNTAWKAITTYCAFMHHKKQQPIVTFSGGEPGIHPRIYEILRTARSHGAFVKVVTNGTALYLTELRDFVDCWHVSVTKPNHELVDFLDYNPGYNIQIQHVLHFNTPNVIDLYGKRGYTIKIWTDFFNSDEQREKDRKTIDGLVKHYSKYDIISRWTGVQENRGKACEGCTKKCVTLKALWMFPDGSVSTCPQGVKAKITPITENVWYNTIENAYNMSNRKTKYASSLLW
jgi:organic radical activating enzyme